MTDTDDLKARVRDAVEEHREDVISLARAIHAEPELGFKETETERKVADAF